jgi:hypothetical protein
LKEDRGYAYNRYIAIRIKKLENNLIVVVEKNFAKFIVAEILFAGKYLLNRKIKFN